MLSVNFRITFLLIIYLFFFVGTIFMVFVEQDNYWYRVRIMEVNNDKEVTVHFIDFGNTEVMVKDRFVSFFMN